MMGKPMVIVPLLVAALAFEAGALSGGCPVGKGICMESRYCKSDRSISSKQHKCFLPNKAKGVCCDARCKTSRGGPGRCVAPEECGHYTRDFLVDRKTLNEAQWWNVTSGVCHETNNTKFYCCPTEQKKPTTWTKPKGNLKSGSDNAFPSCQTPEKHAGRCVPLKLCDRLYTKSIFSHTRKLYKLLWNSKCESNALHSTAVCCQNPPNPDALIQHSKAKKFDLNQCGRIFMTDKVLGGNKAELQQYPWMVNIMYYQNRKKVTLCSGTLIHPKYVLTAAHCSKPGPISVRLGEYDLSRNRDCENEVCAQQFIERSIEKWISHEKYETKKADIALVKLEMAAKLIPGQISPICLPLTEKWLMTKPAQLTVSGWGMMENQRFSDVLMHAELEVLDRSEYCQVEDLICARGTDMGGHCKGDSGGPLQQIMPLEKKYRMVLFGVVSGGAAKCSKDDRTPGVSMLVGHYLRWILDKMEI